MQSDTSGLKPAVWWHLYAALKRRSSTVAPLLLVFTIESRFMQIASNANSEAGSRMPTLTSRLFRGSRFGFCEPSAPQAFLRNTR